MTFAELPVTAWFYLDRDPNDGLLFKSDQKSAMDQQYRQLLISGSERVRIHAPTFGRVVVNGVAQ